MRPAVLLPALLGALALCAGCHHDTSGLTGRHPTPPDGGGAPDAQRDAQPDLDAGPPAGCEGVSTRKTYESATTPTGSAPVLFLGMGSWAVWRFEVTRPFMIDRAGFVGTHMGEGNLWMQIGRLDPPPLVDSVCSHSTPDVLSVGPFGSGPVTDGVIATTVPPTCLMPGWYAVGFASKTAGTSVANNYVSRPMPSATCRAGSGTLSNQGGRARIFVQGLE